MHCIAVYLTNAIHEFSEGGKVDKQLRDIYAIFDESVHPLTSKTVNITDVPSVENGRKTCEGNI